ncbi:hypothetical protein P5V15_011595 [Pogonomyrmex californicus]
MSPTIPILSALLLSLISGSTEGGGGQGMDPVSLLRQTLRYWRKIYKTYNEEVTLGYCWADYLLEISNELSANLSAPPLATTGENRPGATKSQQNPFPRYVMADAATPFGETRGGGKHPRQPLQSHATARSSAISKSRNDPDGRRIASKSKIIQRRGRRVMNKTSCSVAPNSSEIDKYEGITPTKDSHANKRQRALPIVPELSLNDGRKEPRDGHEFLSRGTSSHAVNPTPNPKDDDKVDSGSAYLGEDSRRKVLRSLTNPFDSPVEDASFSLRVARERGSLGGHRFPSRLGSSSQKRNSRVDVETSRDPWTSREDRGIEGDSAGNPRAPLTNNDGDSSSPPPPSRSQFRRVNVDVRRPRTSIVRLMVSEGNSSRDPAIKTSETTPCRKPEELSCDSLLSPRGGSIISERSSFESRGSGGEAVKKDASPRFEIAGRSDAKKQRSRQPPPPPGEEEGSRTGRDISAAPAAVHPFFSSMLERPRRRALYKHRGFSSDFPQVRIPRESRRNDDPVRVARSAPSLSGVRWLIESYEDSTSRSTQNSKLTASQAPQDRDKLSLVQPVSFLSSVRTFVIAALRTLGMFVQIGRQIMDVVETNAALVCTKEYLWIKIIRWIDG